MRHYGIEYDFEEVTHEDFIKFVQSVQSDLIDTPIKFRSIPWPSAPDRVSVFEVYYDGWRELARENNYMRQDRQCLINPYLWNIVLAEIGRDASK